MKRFFPDPSWEDEEEEFWVSGRASVEEVLLHEGLSIVSVFSPEEVAGRSRHVPLSPP